MSYARFGADDSDVYIYMHTDGYLDCCNCSLIDNCFSAYSTQDMIEHLQTHVEQGDIIPDYVFEELKEDDKENFPS